MRQAELRRAAGRLVGLTPAQREAVEALTRGLTNKLLHGPIRAFKDAARTGDGEQVKALRSAFGLPSAVPAQESASDLVEAEEPAPVARRA